MLAAIISALIIDAAMETYWHDSPVRWVVLSIALVALLALATTWQRARQAQPPVLAEAGIRKYKGARPRQRQPLHQRPFVQPCVTQRRSPRHNHSCHLNSPPTRRSSGWVEVFQSNDYARY